MTQKTKTALPPHQIFAVGLILSTLAGYLEAYTYLLRGGVFCNGQTANIALMGALMALSELPLDKEDFTRVLRQRFKGPVLEMNLKVFEAGWIALAAQL